MTIAPEALAYLGTAPATTADGKKVLLLTGSEPAEHQPPQENAMPKKAEKTAPAEKPKRKYTRRPKTAPAPRKAPRRDPRLPAAGPRFGVFEDGTVEIRLAACTGTLSPGDAADLRDFLGRLAK